ncbi:MAG: IS701 family transposase [Streptosporangiaceae bacterium]
MSLSMPAEWRGLLEELAPVFARRSTHRLFMALACGLILADRGTVTGMAAAAGIGRQWRRACWFFAAAAWDADALGLAVARLIVKYLLKEGGPLIVAVDGTFFRRWGRRVAEARWAYDGSAQGGKKVAFGNTWLIAALVVKLPCCPSPVALPVLFRLWRGKGTASQVRLAADLLELLVKAFPGRAVHGTGDAAFHGEPLVTAGTTFTTRLPASAVVHGPKPPPTGKRGRPRKKGDRIGTCKDAAAIADWRDVTVRIYGKEQKVQAAAWPGLWHGSFGDAPGQLVLMREPDSEKPYDLGLFTLDTELSPEAAIERYSWRWAIEPSNAAGKQVTGAGDACNRTARAVERAVPFAFLVQSLMICWYAVSCDPAAGIERRRKRSPWYAAKATPAAGDMRAALRDGLAEARINGISPGSGQSQKSTAGTLTSETQAT